MFLTVIFVFPVILKSPCALFVSPTLISTFPLVLVSIVGRLVETDLNLL